MIQNSPTSEELRITWTMWLCKGLQKCLKWVDIIMEEINCGTHTLELVEVDYLYAQSMEFSYWNRGTIYKGTTSVSNNFMKLFYNG